jgi:hypothetical protein
MADPAVAPSVHRETVIRHVTFEDMGSIVAKVKKVRGLA